MVILEKMPCTSQKMSRTSLHNPWPFFSIPDMSSSFEEPCRGSLSQPTPLKSLREGFTGAAFDKHCTVSAGCQTMRKSDISVLWEKIHKAEHRRKTNLKCDCMYELLQMMSRMELKDPPENFWKLLHLNSLIKYDMKTLKSNLGILNRHTGLPSRTKQVLRPGRRSLMLKLDMQAVAESMQIIGRDKLVELKLLQPGIIIGDQSSVAFVMFTLHFHRLVERSTNENPLCLEDPILKPISDDVDPEHGLHGYQLHVALNDTACDIMSENFSQLFCRRADISDGLIRLSAISRSNPSQHTSLSGSVSLPWSCESLQGNVQNCCVLSVTLLDFCKGKFWCVGSALQETPVCYDYDGEHFLILYQDSEGRVEIQLVKEQTLCCRQFSCLCGCGQSQQAFRYKLLNLEQY
ncbi:hypothetical protein F7725_028504 [Dissostichus mawsoni]|uniref:Uncharacterized protein n=1 Tax=Dissostichus mawsoni TaxID=36200 RepID=A0A7J5XFW0_DISMA|nr:hypothetical protein F7725_028504 [Dissostichus mawsoni]